MCWVRWVASKIYLQNNAVETCHGASLQMYVIMEILDLYDRDLKPTGQTIERGKRVPPGLMIPIVAVYVYNDQGQYLIQKVSPNKGNFLDGEKFVLPFA